MIWIGQSYYYRPTHFITNSNGNKQFAAPLRYKTNLNHSLVCNRALIFQLLHYYILSVFIRYPVGITPIGFGHTEFLVDYSMLFKFITRDTVAVKGISVRLKISILIFLPMFVLIHVRYWHYQCPFA